MILPKITKKQQEILKLIYSYRYLNRIQIQTLMNHKDKKTINLWLKDLTEKQCVKRIYSDHFLEKTKPAIYYMGINGIRYLKTLEEEQYPIEELRKRYKEHERSQSFIDRSVLIAQCRLDLKAKLKLIPDKSIKYYIATEADYMHPDHTYHFLAEHEAIRPNFCVIKQGQNNTDEEPITTNYLLEIFDNTLPRYRVKKRIKSYVDYLINDDWDSEGNNSPPIILLVMPTLVELIYAKRRTKKLFDNEGFEADDEETQTMHIRFTTIEQLKQQGLTASIWEERREVFRL